MLRDKPLVPELSHRVDDGEERLTLCRQLVVDPPALTRPRDDSLLLKDAQALRERPRADARAGPLQLGKTPWAFGEIVDDHGRPLRSDDVRGARDRAVRVVHGPHRSHVTDCTQRTTQSHGGAPKTQRPPSIVATTFRSLSS